MAIHASTIEEGLALMNKCFWKLQTMMEDEKKRQRISISTEEYIAMHGTVFELCSSHDESDINAARFCSAYIASLSDYLSANVAPSLLPFSGAELLRELQTKWVNYSLTMTWLSRVLGYLDRCYLARMSLPKLAKTGSASFYELVEGPASEALLALLERHRDGDGDADRLGLMRNVAIGVLMESGGIDRYRADLEAKVLEATTGYYSRKAAMWHAGSCSFPRYMVKAEEAIRQERERVRDFLHLSSEHKVVAAARAALLAAPSLSLELMEDHESGFRALIRGDMIEDVKRVLGLYYELPDELGRAAAQFGQQVGDEGIAIVRGDDEDRVIESLFALHAKYSVVYLRGCFGEHERFRTELTEAMKRAANGKVGGKQTAELLAEFCDDVLKRGGRGEKMSDEALEEALEGTVTLLSFVDDKDLFCELHRKKLARRLLFGRTISREQEKSLVAKLKRGFGPNYAAKLETMLSDVAVSKDTHAEFKSAGINVDFTATVLTTTHWPTYKSTDMAAPAEMAKCVEAYSQFYKSKFKDRRLSFVYSLGTCDIRGSFDSKPIDLAVSTYQAALLLLFNDTDRLSYTEIAVALNMDGQDLSRVLNSLSCGKYKILKRTAGQGAISESDEFEFNSKFDDPMRRIKIALPPTVDQQERKKVSHELEKKREYNVDAAIVRIMKARKLLSYQNLIIECVDQLKPIFKPDVKIIKKRIDNLIERDFLERDQQNQNLFHYLA